MQLKDALNSRAAMNRPAAAVTACAEAPMCAAKAKAAPVAAKAKAAPVKNTAGKGFAKGKAVPKQRAAMKRPAAATAKGKAKSKPLKPFPSEKQRLKLFPHGCGKCRGRRGCTPSCWVYRGHAPPCNL